MITDTHCHVLPGLDDGPKTMAESIAVLSEMVRQGVGRLIVTPHYHPERYPVCADRVLETLERVRAEAAAQGLTPEMIPGQECWYYTGLARDLNAGRVLTMADSGFVLVEFDPDVPYSMLRGGLRDLVMNGFTPILAHFERYTCLSGRTDRLEEARGDGALLQMNFDRLLDRGSLFSRSPWRKLARDGYVDLMGSDTHGMAFRPPHIAEAVRWMEKELPPGRAGAILDRNVRALLTP